MGRAYLGAVGKVAGVVAGVGHVDGRVFGRGRSSVCVVVVGGGVCCFAVAEAQADDDEDEDERRKRWLYSRRWQASKQPRKPVLDAVRAQGLLDADSDGS